jgi:hypothetical protein
MSPHTNCKTHCVFTQLVWGRINPALYAGMLYVKIFEMLNFRFIKYVPNT